MPEIACARLPGRGFLRLAGPDARGFLQGLVTADVDGGLAPDRALHAALLTPQGKYLYDFFLHDAGDGSVLLDAEAARLPALAQRLTMYRLRAQVTIAEEPDLVTLALFGPGTPGTLGLPAAAGAAKAGAGGAAPVVAVDPRLAALGLRAVLPEAAAEGFARALDATPAGFAAYDRHRLGLGVPDGTRDLVPERSLLLENGFDELNGVSFTKGCFVGQELTARTKHRALIKKRLLPVAVAGPLPDPGTPVLRGGRDAGEMRSGVDGLGLALLRLGQLAPDAGARGADPLACGEAVLTPAPPPWLRLPEAGSR